MKGREMRINNRVFPFKLQSRSYTHDADEGTLDKASTINYSASEGLVLFCRDLVCNCHFVNLADNVSKSSAHDLSHRS